MDKASVDRIKHEILLDVLGHVGEALDKRLPTLSINEGKAVTRRHIATDKKYVVTDDTISVYCKNRGKYVTLHRIKATVDITINTTIRDGELAITKIPAGTLGGFVESAHNLSPESSCWIGGDTKVFGNARVTDRAVVDEFAVVYGDAVIQRQSHVQGHATIAGRANISGRALVEGRAKIFGVVSGCGYAGGRAVVQGYGRVIGGTVAGFAVIHPGSTVESGATVTGKAEIRHGVTLKAGALVEETGHYTVIGSFGRNEIYYAYRTGDGSGFRIRSDLHGFGKTYDSVEELEYHSGLSEVESEIVSLHVQNIAEGWGSYESPIGGWEALVAEANEEEDARLQEEEDDYESGDKY